MVRLKSLTAALGSCFNVRLGWILEVLALRNDSFHKTHLGVLSPRDSVARGGGGWRRRYGEGVG